MDFGCCSNHADGDELSRDLSEADSADRNNSLVSFSDSNESLDDKSHTLDCDYRDATPLFRAIEQEDWKGILLFLTTGKWSKSPLASSYGHMQSPSPELQARTWVTSTDNHGDVKWSQLPIHAAISYLAPLPVIQKLFELHPEGIRSADDTGNLPLHLAFGFGVADSIVSFLIKEFPQALSLRGLQNRLPIECADLGPNKTRGEIIQACQDHTRSLMMKEWDHHWKRSLADAKRKAGLKGSYSTSKKTLEDVFDEFMQVKKELEKTKEMVKNRPTMIITKTEPVPTPVAPKSVGKSPSDVSRIFTFGSNLGRRISGRRSKRKNLLHKAKTSPSPSPDVAIL
jgi:hypothetical protein